MSGPGAMADGFVSRLDALQQRYPVLGFPYAVVRKYLDDRGGRHAALITYYGFLSIFPILLLAVTVLSTVLVNRPALREAMVEALLPEVFQDTVNTALTGMPSSGLALVVGLVGLVLSGTGVVFSVYETLNHVAGVPLRSRHGWIARFARAMLMVVVVLTGGLGVAALTVASGALPDVGELQRAANGLGTAAVVFVVLIAAAMVLIAKPTPLRAVWMPAAVGALVVAVVLTVGARLLAPLVASAGPVYGSFATVAGVFTLLYLVSQSLVYAAEAAVVRHRRLWPRTAVPSRPTPADRVALTRLATVAERLDVERIEVRFDAPARDA